MLYLPRTEKPDIGIPLDWSNTLNEGLVLEMPFNEDAGGVVADLSGYGNDGTLSGPTWGPGKDGPALIFDGTSNRIIVDRNNSLLLTGTLSFVAWVRTFDIATTAQHLVGFYDSSNPYPGWGVMYNRLGNQKLEYWSGTKGSWVISTTGIDDTEWHHVAVIVGPDESVYFYFDGVFSNSVATNFPNAYSGTACIAARSDGDDGFKGQISNVSINNRALTAAEIQQLCQNTWQRYQPRSIPYAAAVAAVHAGRLVNARRLKSKVGGGLV